MATVFFSVNDTTPNEVNLTGSNTPTEPRFAYIANNGNNTITHCDITAEDPYLINCSASNTDSRFSGPRSITFNAAGTFAFVTNGSTFNISRCTVNTTTGILESCDAGSVYDMQAQIFNGITFNNDGDIAYVSDQTFLDSKGIHQCDFDSDNGLISDCTPSGLNFSRPNGVTLNAAGTIAYIPNSANNTISVCPVNAGTGALEPCTVFTDPNSTISNPSNVTLDPAGKYAYIGNSNGGQDNNAISVCPINSTTGALSACSGNKVIDDFRSTKGIGFYASGTIAYIVNRETPYIARCTVTPSTGELSDCAKVTPTGTADFSLPEGLTFF
jgi:6-phosphogluconolactonase (cycloisomerase 2 family)